MPNSKPFLQSTDVKKVLAAAEAHAQKNGWAVHIVVTDDGGYTLGALRLDGVAPMASLIAAEKARITCSRSRVITAYHAKYYANELTRRNSANGVDRLSQSLFDASVDLNPHQIEAALFALRNPLQQGVMLADEVGLGKTIEAALVLCQYWAERRRRLIIICPASLRKQWAQELHDKFAVPSIVVDAVLMRNQKAGNALATLQAVTGKQVLIMSYQFAAKLEAELRAIAWDIVVIDEAHKLRNAHRASNRIPVGFVGEIHLAGYEVVEEGDDELLIDTHSRPVYPEVWALYQKALERFGAIPTLIEWDQDIPPLQTLQAEAEKAQAYLDQVYLPEAQPIAMRA